MVVLCPTCQEVIATAAGLAFHQKYGLCRYKCNYCERQFRTVVEATNHQNEMHIESAAESTIKVKSKEDELLETKIAEEAAQNLTHAIKREIVLEIEDISAVDHTCQEINSLITKLEDTCQEINSLDTKQEDTCKEINSLDTKQEDTCQEINSLDTKQEDTCREMNCSSVESIQQTQPHEIKNKKEPLVIKEISAAVEIVQEIQRQTIQGLDKSVEICDSSVGKKIVREIQMPTVKREEPMEIDDNSDGIEIIQQIQTPTARKLEESMQMDNNSVAVQIVQDILTNAMNILEEPVKVGDRTISSSEDKFIDWKQDPFLPQGWRVLATTYGEKNREMFLSPTGQIFKSRENVIKFLKKEGILTDLEPVTAGVVSKSFLPEIKHVEDPKIDEMTKNLYGNDADDTGVTSTVRKKHAKPRRSGKNYFQETSPRFSSREKSKSRQKGTNSKRKLEKIWVEDDPSVPSGWKIRIQRESTAHFMSKGGTKKESFLSPSGKLFSSRNAVLDHLLNDGNASLKDIDIVEKATGKVDSQWIASSNIPEGWKSRKVRGKEMFLSPTGEMFLGRVAVLEHLVSSGAPPNQIVKVEKGIKGVILIWRGDKDLPSGWTLRSVYGLDHSREKSLFKSPSGDIYVGNHILKAMNETESDGAFATTIVDHTKVNVTTLDDTLAAMLEPIVDLKELSMTEWNNTNGCNSISSTIFGATNEIIKTTVQDDDSDSISLSDDEVEEIFENEKQSNSIVNVSKVNGNQQASVEFQETNGFPIVNGKNLNLSEHQLEILEMAYSQWPDPFKELVDELVRETKLKAEDVTNWFNAKTSKQISKAISKTKSCQNGLEPSERKEYTTNVHDVPDIAKEKTKQSRKGGRKHPPDALKILLISFKSNPDAPNGQRLENLKQETGLTKMAIKRWFYRRKFGIGKNGCQELIREHSKSVNSDKVSAKGKAEKGSRNAKCDWNQDPTLPTDWTFRWMNGDIMFRSPEGQLYQSRMEVITHLQTLESSGVPFQDGRN